MCAYTPGVSPKHSPEVLYKKSILRNFAIFTGKHLCWSLFLIKLQAFKSAILLKRDSSTGAFLNIVKFLRTPVLKNICERLLMVSNTST